MPKPFICTNETPWRADLEPRPTLILHPAARKVGEQRNGYPGGDIVTKRCPICGEEWETELPQ